MGKDTVGRRYAAAGKDVAEHLREYELNGMLTLPVITRPRHGSGHLRHPFGRSERLLIARWSRESILVDTVVQEVQCDLWEFAQPSQILRRLHLRVGTGRAVHVGSIDKKFTPVDATRETPSTTNRTSRSVSTWSFSSKNGIQISRSIPDARISGRPLRYLSSRC